MFTNSYSGRQQIAVRLYTCSDTLSLLDLRGLACSNRLEEDEAKFLKTTVRHLGSMEEVWFSV